MTMYSPNIMFKFFSVGEIIKIFLFADTPEVISAEGSHKASHKNSQSQGNI